MLFTWNPSPLRPSKFSFEYLLLPPRSAPVEARLGLTPKASVHTTATLLLDITLFSKLQCRSSIGFQRFSAIHFQDWLIRQVSCYTLLSGFRLPWPPSCCLEQPTPFVGSDLRPVGRLNSTFGSSHSASSAYQKWPTWHSSIHVKMKRLHLSESFFLSIQSLRIG